VRNSCFRSGYGVNTPYLDPTRMALSVSGIPEPSGEDGYARLGGAKTTGETKAASNDNGVDE